MPRGGGGGGGIEYRATMAAVLLCSALALAADRCFLTLMRWSANGSAAAEEEEEEEEEAVAVVVVVVVGGALVVVDGPGHPSRTEVADWEAAVIAAAR